MEQKRFRDVKSIKRIFQNITIKVRSAEKVYFHATNYRKMQCESKLKGGKYYDSAGNFGDVH